MYLNDSDTLRSLICNNLNFYYFFQKHRFYEHWTIQIFQKLSRSIGITNKLKLEKDYLIKKWRWCDWLAFWLAFWFIMSSFISMIHYKAIDRYLFFNWLHIYGVWRLMIFKKKKNKIMNELCFMARVVWYYSFFSAHALQCTCFDFI